MIPHVQAYTTREYWKINQREDFLRIIICQVYYYYVEPILTRFALYHYIECSEDYLKVSTFS